MTAALGSNPNFSTRSSMPLSRSILVTKASDLASPSVKRSLRCTEARFPPAAKDWAKAPHLRSNCPSKPSTRKFLFAGNGFPFPLLGHNLQRKKSHETTSIDDNDRRTLLRRATRLRRRQNGLALRPFPEHHPCSRRHRACADAAAQRLVRRTAR